VIRSTLVIGYVTIVRLLMLELSNMSVPKLFVSFFGYWASCLLATEPKNSRSRQPDLGATVPRSISISELAVYKHHNFVAVTDHTLAPKITQIMKMLGSMIVVFEGL
jgi:hypothetical protein